VLRCYCQYLRQIDLPYSVSYVTRCLVDNHALALTAIDIFETRFDPQRGSNDASELISSYYHSLDQVESLDQDRILRGLGDAICATVRSNYFLCDEQGQSLDRLAIKLLPSGITGIPLPCPEFEIFVSSARVEAVHLRGGKVARGGLRWSDRHEDFRTEILGLMKAQMVKNSVIVPVGSKGGFVVKQAPAGASREQLMAEVVHCYQTFLRGLLDITDNYIDGEIVTPAGVVRHDEPDPYLVVAADKGTATFSDIANSVSAEYGFWLGDAFASGGSDGYDHKGMGITAKGAWESVKRHFRELGTDTQTEAFSVIGIGDMGGDVFGNGMLLSDQIRLLGAFNHLHIFLDPTPDAASSFAERQRLFELPRSSWEDYNAELISAGGGVFSRAMKSIALSPQVKQMLGTDHDSMTPTELIHAMLKAECDLLWNGGIGTYIKESGRTEFTHAGGKIYTDAIDNSAGVDCSDHEVNIKILIDALVAGGQLPSEQRSALLAQMTDEVGDLVLVDNYQQTQCISLSLAQAPQLLDEHARFIQALESQGKLNREIEFLPGDEEIAERKSRGEGLSAPEIAVITAYSKMDLYGHLLESSLVDDEFFDLALARYFPTPLQQQFAEQIQQHQLRREIIATIVTNNLVNRLGPTFTHRLQEEINATPPQIAAAFAAISELYGMHETWSEIEQLDNQISARAQTDMLLMARGWVERGVHWSIVNRHCDQPVSDQVAFFRSGVEQLRSCIADVLPTANRNSLESRVRYFRDAGVSAQLANTVAKVVPLSSALDIIQIAASQRIDVQLAAAVYHQLGAYLKLQWLRDQIAALHSANHWHSIAYATLRADLLYQHRHLTAEVLAHASAQSDNGQSDSGQSDRGQSDRGQRANGSDPAAAERMIDAWANSLPSGIDTYQSRIIDINTSEQVDYTLLSLAVAEVHKLQQNARPLAGSQQQSG